MRWLYEQSMGDNNNTNTRIITHTHTQKSNQACTTTTLMEPFNTFSISMPRRAHTNTRHDPTADDPSKDRHRTCTNIYTLTHSHHTNPRAHTHGGRSPCPLDMRRTPIVPFQSHSGNYTATRWLAAHIYYIRRDANANPQTPEWVRAHAFFFFLMQ